VEELFKVRVVDVGEDPEQLAIQVPTRESVVFGKVVGSCREGGRIVEEVLSPREDKVDVDRCRQFDWFAVGVYPSIVESARTGTSTPSSVPDRVGVEG
jgi:hypothetical protein